MDSHAWIVAGTFCIVEQYTSLSMHSAVPTAPLSFEQAYPSMPNFCLARVTPDSHIAVPLPPCPKLVTGNVTAPGTEGKYEKICPGLRGHRLWGN
jgi:hypothetical protein